VYISFGDNINGAAPISGQTIQVRYRIGGGIRGRIGSGAINQSKTFSPEAPITATVTVQFQNAIPSNGGYDVETLDQAKARGPKTWATHDFIATAPDYKTASSSFKHPVYGSVVKATATVHTAINANLVRINVLADGVNGTPVVPSLGLKKNLESYLSSVNVLTDSVEVLDGKIKPIDFDANIIIYRNADASFVKNQVEAVLGRFFDTANWDMGQPLYIANLYDQIMAINGVRYLDIFKPKDDILPLKDVGVTKLVDCYYAENNDKLIALIPTNPRFMNVIYTKLANFEFSLTCQGTVGCDIDYLKTQYVLLYGISIVPIGCCDTYMFGSYENTIDYDELIVLGNKNIRYYYEKSE
jgi:hypothetical protein